jgi:hypothetical protein
VKKIALVVLAVAAGVLAKKQMAKSNAERTLWAEATDKL